MRTTIDLDPDVDARLRAIARERGLPLRTVINQALRDGTHPARHAEPFALRTHPLGIRSGVNIDKALERAAEDEDEETLRKVELRK